MTARPALMLLLLCATSLCQEDAKSEPRSRDCTIENAARELLPFFRQITANAVKRPIAHVHNKLSSVVERLAKIAGTFRSIQTEQASLKIQQEDHHKDVKADTSFIIKNLYNITQFHRKFESRLKKLENLLQSRAMGQTQPPKEKLMRSCSELRSIGGVYLLQLGANQEPVRAFCRPDKDDRPWTIIQRRDDITPREDFSRGWEAYKRGFGQLDNKEFWWGLENLFQLTSQPGKSYELDISILVTKATMLERGQAMVPTPVVSARYADFRILSEAEHYQLKLGKYLNLKSSIPDSFLFGIDRNNPFSTEDADHDSSQKNCAKLNNGWWYKECGNGNLNGVYHDEGSTRSKGIYMPYLGEMYVILSAEMKIRPM